VKSAVARNAEPVQEANAAGSRGRQRTLLFVVNVASFFLSHRLPLARAARAAGSGVHPASHAESDADRTQVLRTGIEFHELAVPLFVLVTFVIVLSLNSGTCDFSFSTDIHVLLVCLVLTFRFVRVRIPAAASAAVAAART
jgi:hypothetical protein